MRVDIIVRSFLIASLISLIALLLEAAYYGLHPGNTYGTTYALTAAFVNNFSDLSSPLNIMLLTIIFISTFVIVSNRISKREQL